MYEIVISGRKRLADWPEGLPRDYTELHKRYNPKLLLWVKRWNKEPLMLEDLLQEMFKRLMEAQVLLKFFEKTARTLPSTMFAPEAAKFMGLTMTEFRRALYFRTSVGLNFQPIPVPNQVVPAGLYDEAALFSSADILALDQAIPDELRTEQCMLAWPTQALGFLGYLYVSARSRWLNWCRTRRRKDHKETTIDSSATSLTAHSSGRFTTGRVLRDDGGAESPNWESALVSQWMDEEDMMDVREAIHDEFSEFGLDPSLLAEVEPDSKRPTQRAQHMIGLLDAVIAEKSNQGRSFSDVIQTQHERGRVRVRA